MNNMTKLSTILSMIVLVGCATGPRVDPIEINKTVEPVKVLHPPLPDDISWEDVKVTILTPDKMREILKQLEDGKISERDAVFVALTPDGYEHLSVNLAELKRYIEDQKSVIMYYRKTVPNEIFLPKDTGG